MGKIIHMQWKRLLTIVMTVALLCTAFTACKTTDTTSSTSDETSSGSSSAASTTAKGSSGSSASSGSSTGSEAGGDSSGSVTVATNAGTVSDTSSGGTSYVKDLNGRVINIDVVSDEVKKIFMEPDGEYYASFQEAQQRYNCTFNFNVVALQDLIDSVTQQSLAGTADFDVAMVEGYHAVPKDALSGEYLCLSDYYDYSTGAWASPPTSNGRYMNKQYALPIGNDPVYGIFYNKKLVAEANLPDPWTYVDSNTWNWDTFKTFAKALTKDTTGDGIPDQYGFVSEEIFAQFIMTNGSDIINTSSASGATFDATNDQSKAAMEYVLGLYDEKIVPTTEEIVTQGLDSSFKAMTTGKCAMFPYSLGYASYLTDQAGFDPDDVGYIYFPKGPSATDYVSACSTQQNMFMVLKNTSAPEEVIAALSDAMAYWSSDHASAVSISTFNENVTQQDQYLDFFSNANHLKMYNYLTDNRFKCHNLYSYTDACTLIKTMWYDIMTDTYTIQGGIDAYSSSITEAIKKAEQ